MDLDFKKAVKDVFGLKYFWVYLFIFAVVITLGSIFQAAENMPYHNLISKAVSVLTYISSGYLFIMVHNLLNNKDLNSESFAQSFFNSLEKGFIVFTGTVIFVFTLFFLGALELIVATLFFIKITGNVVTEMNLFSFPVLNVIYALTAILLCICMFFILKILPVAYSNKYSLKEMFCWKKVFNAFFKNGKAKDTFLVILTYAFIVIIAIVLSWGIKLVFDLIMIYFTKSLLINHYMAVLLLSHISNVAVPFLIGMFHFSIQGITYHLLAQIYSRNDYI